MSIRESTSSLEAADEVASVGSIIIMLPRPIGDSYYHAMRPSELALDTGLATMSNSSSRILVSRSKERSAPDFPPTPPMYSRQSSASHDSSKSLSPDTKSSPSAELNKPSLTKRPHRRNSPPTPDLSPARESRAALQLPNSHQDPSSGSNSFKTAREDPYSSGEDCRSKIHPVLSRIQNSEVKMNNTRTEKRQNERRFHLVTAPNQSTKSPENLQVYNSNTEFGKFDGQWGSSKEVNNANLEKNFRSKEAGVPHQPIRHTHSTSFRNGDQVIDILQPKMIARTLSLQDHTPKYRRSEPARRSLAEFKYLEKAHPPTPSMRKTQELSPISVIIGENISELLPARRRTLRHTKKCMGLRDLGDSNTRSTARYSMVQDDLRYEQNLNAPSLNPSQRTPSRAISTGSLGSNLSLKHRKEIIRNGGIPVLVIPERLTRSKSKPPSLRSTSSRKTRRSMSLGSAPWSHSTKYHLSESSDRAGLPSRMVSVSAKSGYSVRTIDYPPCVPTRRSSLSARTNSNASRTGSLTAESLKAHNLLHAKKPTLEVKPCAGLPAIEINGFDSNTIIDPNGDSIQENRLSSQITPFSQISNETTGTVAEVSEALAISLFPHQNKSLVLVQNRQSPELPLSTSTFKPRRGNDPVTSKTIHRNTSAISPIIPIQNISPTVALNSPFSNPRDPPKPPMQEQIGRLSPNHVESLENLLPIYAKLPGRSKSLIRPKKSQSASDVAQPFGFIRRTLSASFRPKGHAETTLNTPSKRRVISDLYPPTKDNLPHNNKLHPFWRPAKFWDSLDDNGLYRGNKLFSPEKLSILPKRTKSEQLKRRIKVLPPDDCDGPFMPWLHRNPVYVSDVHKRMAHQNNELSLRDEDIKKSFYPDKESSVNNKDFSLESGFQEIKPIRTRTISGLSLSNENTRWIELRRWASEKRAKVRDL
ncbi:hypothetical protein K3495_g7636 [Podosphaera aphanis]|nr:hypothetical protein K3495_g7636 [Podosphaera aphanis]